MSSPYNFNHQAVFLLKAERIGHGYHAVDNEDTYRSMREMNIHFEVCPLSSMLTASVPQDPRKHPLARLNL